MIVMIVDYMLGDSNLHMAESFAPNTDGTIQHARSVLNLATGESHESWNVARTPEQIDTEYGAIAENMENGWYRDGNVSFYRYE